MIIQINEVDWVNTDKIVSVQLRSTVHSEDYKDAYPGEFYLEFTMDYDVLIDSLPGTASQLTSLMDAIVDRTSGKRRLPNQVIDPSTGFPMAINKKVGLDERGNPLIIDPERTG